MTYDKIIKVNQSKPIAQEHPLPEEKGLSGTIKLKPASERQKQGVPLERSSGSAQMRKREGTWRY
jgi:hypothetical protein